MGGKVRARAAGASGIKEQSEWGLCSACICGGIMQCLRCRLRA